MKGIVSGIKRMEVHDGDGLRTTVFFKGCPLKCIWCHNPESISFKKQVAYFGEKCVKCGLCKGTRDERAAETCPANALVAYGREYSPEELFREVMKDEAFFRNGGGVTFSGGECLMQGEFAVSLATLFYDAGISVFVDTCGFVSYDVLSRIAPLTDKFLYDIKAYDSQLHKKCTGVPNQLILENLMRLAKDGAKIEIRYPLIKGINDGECEKIGAFLSEIAGIERVKILAYHSFSTSRYEALGMENTLPDTETTFDDVEVAVKTLRSFGLCAVNGMSES